MLIQLGSLFCWTFWLRQIIQEVMVEKIDESFIFSSLVAVLRRASNICLQHKISVWTVVWLSIAQIFLAFSLYRL